MPETAAEQVEVVLTRDFAAPRPLVFKVFTESDHLARWWGPKGLTMRTLRVDLRPGGLFHYRMTAPSGSEMWGKFVYREIAPPERLSFVNSFSDADGNTTRHPLSAAWPLEVLTTVIFAERDATSTTLTLRGYPINASDTEIATFQAGHASMRGGFQGTFEQLDAYLAELQQGAA